MSGFDSRPTRVLHVLGGMDVGGVETWLMHVLRHADRRCIAIDLAVHTAKKCAFDDEVRSLGARILPCLDPRQPVAYRRRLLQVLHEFGPYDVVHSHVHHFSGYVLRVARTAGVPIRIAHAHTDTRAATTDANLVRRSYLRLMRRWIKTCSTHGLACSASAANQLFGPSWQTQGTFRLLPCGIDLRPFSERVDARSIRAGLGLPADAFVMGHVGRFIPSKNHDFLIQVAKEVFKRRDNSYLLLVGDGPLRDSVSRLASHIGILDRIIFAGVRGDVPRLMLGAMDVFVFPSRYEGLGVVLVEAQAAGLPVVLTDSLPLEVGIVPPLVNRVSLNSAPSVWADLILKQESMGKNIGQDVALALIRGGAFDVRTGVSSLARIYRSRIDSSPATVRTA